MEFCSIEHIILEPVFWQVEWRLEIYDHLTPCILVCWLHVYNMNMNFFTSQEAKLWETLHWMIEAHYLLWKIFNLENNLCIQWDDSFHDVDLIPAIAISPDMQALYVNKIPLV